MAGQGAGPDAAAASPPLDPYPTDTPAQGGAPDGQPLARQGSGGAPPVASAPASRAASARPLPDPEDVAASVPAAASRLAAACISTRWGRCARLPREGSGEGESGSTAGKAAPPPIGRFGRSTRAPRHRALGSSLAAPSVSFACAACCPLKVIGRGGYSVVHKGLRLSDGLTVAIKRIEVFELSAKKRDRCLAEVALLRSLAHPGIIGMLDAFVDVDGGNVLTIVIEVGRLPLPWVSPGNPTRPDERSAPPKPGPQAQSLTFPFAALAANICRTAPEFRGAAVGRRGRPEAAPQEDRGRGAHPGGALHLGLLLAGRLPAPPLFSAVVSRGLVSD